MIEDFLTTVVEFIRDENELTDRPSLTQDDIDAFLSTASPADKARIAKLERQAQRLEDEHHARQIAHQAASIVRSVVVAHSAVDTLLNPPAKACGFSGVGYSGGGMHVVGGGGGIAKGGMGG